MAATVRKPNAASNVQCGNFCGAKFRRRDGVATATGKLVCKTCGPAAPKPAKRPKAAHSYFVLQCEPGKDARVRKELMRAYKIWDLEHLFGRVIIPRALKDGLVRPAGEILAEGSCELLRNALLFAEEAAWHLYGEIPEEDARGPGSAHADELRARYRWTAWQDEKTGRFVWKVRTKEPLARKVVKAKKYPGYLIVHMTFAHESEKLIGSLVRFGAGGLLLRPVVNNLLVKVTSSRPHGFRWKVVHPECGEVMELDGKPAAGTHRNKDAAAEAGRAAKAKLEEFHPTALRSQEEAELLISQRAVNEIYKDKEELNRAIVNYKVGDAVRITDGVWKNVMGRVVRLDKTNPKDPQVTIACLIMGVEVQQTVKFWEAVRC